MRIVIEIVNHTCIIASHLLVLPLIAFDTFESICSIEKKDMLITKRARGLSSRKSICMPHLSEIEWYMYKHILFLPSCIFLFNDNKIHSNIDTCTG